VMPRVGDAAELLERERAGWTCEPTPDGLARALLAALRDPEMRRAAGQNALALAKGPLAWSVLAERLERAYHSTLNRTLARAAVKRSVAGVRD
jgi:glycosyltransferase involved in cell wall biosynthesis